MSLRGIGTFGAFRHAEFRLLFGGLIAGNLGIWMQQFALGWLMVQLAVAEGRPDLAPFYLGLRSLAGAVPALAFGLFAGVIADRIDRRDLLQAARIASAVVAVLLAALVIADRATLPLVLLLAAASSAAFAFDPPGRQAILPNVVPARDLLSAMGLTRASMQVARTFGPLAAGLLVLPVGVGGVLLVKAGLDVVTVDTLRRMRPQPVDQIAGNTGIFASLTEGLRHMGRDGLIRWCIVLQLVFAICVNSIQELLPALAVDSLHVGAIELSWLVAAVGIGALLGAFVVASSGGIRRTGLVLLLAMLCAGAMLVVLGAQRSLIGTLIVLFVLGVAAQVFMGTQAVILQLAAPEQLRGRIMGIQSVVFMSTGPLGVFALGSIGTVIGISNAFLLAGLVVLAFSVIALLTLTVIRDLSHARPQGVPLTTAPVE